MEWFMPGAYFDIMAKAGKVYGRYMEPVCRAWGLTRNELDVMLFLYNNPRFDRAADIVGRRGIAKSHVSLSVSGLEARGFLRRSASAEDRRMTHLSLTKEGLAAAREAREVQLAFFGRLTGSLTEEELQQWERLTEKLWQGVETMARDPE